MARWKTIASPSPRPIRPAFDLEYDAQVRHWSCASPPAPGPKEGFPTAYDNVNNQFLASYVRAVQRSIKRMASGRCTGTYPLRFSFGLQQQTFYNFTGGNSTKVLPMCG